MECPNGLNGLDEVLRIKKVCTDRIAKYGLYSVKSGACKGCPYRYRGTNTISCCIFGDLPYSWSDESIKKSYPQ